VSRPKIAIHKKYPNGKTAQKWQTKKVMVLAIEFFIKDEALKVLTH
jgi:hypothetical protein